MPDEKTTGAAPAMLSEHVPVVAIGSSADGVGSLREIVGGLPATLGAAVIIVQHLAPSRTSSLAWLLGRVTRMAVKEARDGDVLMPGTIYVAPPGVHLSLADGSLRLTMGPKVAYARPSIDVLFSSLAATCGERAVAVVLGGAGRDGSMGLAEVRKAGGRTIVLDPRDARYARMPEAAIAQDGHRILRFHEITPELRRLVAAMTDNGAAVPS